MAEGFKKALEKAKEIALLSHSDVTLLNVTDISKYFIADYEVHLVSQNIEHGKELLKSLLEKFKDFEGKVDTVHKVGDSSREIKVAEEGNYDLVVMGSRELGTFSKVFLGSVSNKVLNHIKKTVLIVT